MKNQLKSTALQNIARQLLNMKKADYNLRQTLADKGALDNGYNAEMAEMHALHAKKLETIIDDIGYPTESLVGKEACNAAWLTIQHAIAHPQFVKKCLVLLSSAVKAGDASAVHKSYLYDRIAYYEGKPQLYGTQFDWDNDGKMSPVAFDSLEKVNARRKALGLNSLDEQTKIMQKQADIDNLKPPKNLKEHKKAFERWKVACGWINSIDNETS